MYPGTLIADIAHLEKVFVDPCIGHSFLEEGFMGPGRTGGHHHPVQPLIFDNLS